MPHTTFVLLGSTNTEFHEQVRQLGEQIEIVTKDRLEKEPEFWSKVEIIYGGAKNEQLAQATRLRWMQLSSAGVNRWLTDEFRDRDVLVTTTSGIHAHPITEHMFGMLLQVTRCLPQAYEQQKTRQWRGYDFNANLDMIAGKTLGLLGVGAIGEQSARVGKAFGMKVIGLRRSGEPHPDIEEMYTPENRLEFFSRCDVLMNTLPLTEKSRHFMGREELRALPAGAIVINTGRGATIDTEALMAVLQEGHLKAALLDVTDPEPLPAEHPLWAFPNVFITPHYSGGHPQYEERANVIFLDNLGRFLRGEELRNVVDKAEGY